MQLGILGTGNVAWTLARRWAAAGHQVTFGSRDPGAKDGLDAPVTTPAEAVAGSDVVVNATPGSASLEVVEKIGERLRLRRRHRRQKDSRCPAERLRVGR